MMSSHAGLVCACARVCVYSVLLTELFDSDLLPIILFHVFLCNCDCQCFLIYQWLIFKCLANTWQHKGFNLCVGGICNQDNVTIGTKDRSINLVFRNFLPPPILPPHPPVFFFLYLPSIPPRCYFFYSPLSFSLSLSLAFWLSLSVCGTLQRSEVITFVSV